MKTVFLAGTFDILHQGHLFFMKEAKKYGDKLVVVVARDSTVKRIKGKLPKNNEKERLNKIQQLNFVDKVVLGKEGDLFEILKDIKPDIICLGYDQKVNEEKLKNKLNEFKINAKIIRIKSYQPEKYKSSLMS